MTIASKKVAKSELDECLKEFDSKGLTDFMSELNKRLLQRKVKFPVLESVAEKIVAAIPAENHIFICNSISDLGTEGGNVLLGKILQARLENHFDESVQHAQKYIEFGAEWYVSDIIGERVFGWGLLHHFEKTHALFQLMKKHSSPWVVRSIGAGTHYAVKKGLGGPETERAFQVLLSLSNSTLPQIKTGIGWAAKTVSKFHPEIISLNSTQINDRSITAQWFRNKISIGLKRHKYAQAN